MLRFPVVGCLQGTPFVLPSPRGVLDECPFCSWGKTQILVGVGESLSGTPGNPTRDRQVTLPQAGWALTQPSPQPCRDWYLNGNYLVILVSVTVILPLALMRQLGECGRDKPQKTCCRALEQRTSSLTAPLALHRLPGLLQRLLPQLHGVLSDCGQSPGVLGRGRA